MPHIRVEGICKRFGKAAVLREISLEAPSGRLTAILGPSGSGKTTLLRIIAGLEEPDQGEVYIGSELLSSAEKNVFVPVQRRDIGMVFQSYALWPHLTVFENIAFPLRVRGISNDEVHRKVHEAMALVHLPDLADRRPDQTSGGEQQRVALARALVYRPRLLLLDEPLANLDTRVREQVRGEILRLQKQVGVTTFYVTHDQSEALSMADWVVLMNEGSVVQQGLPRELYRKPATRFAAKFLGASNVVHGRLRKYAGGRTFVELAGGVSLSAASLDGIPDGAEVTACLRPEDLEIRSGSTPDAVKEAWGGTVESVLFLGEYVQYVVVCDGLSLAVKANMETRYQVGQNVSLRIKPNRATLFAG